MGKEKGDEITELKSSIPFDNLGESFEMTKDAQPVSVQEMPDITTNINEKSCSICTFINSVDAAQC